MDFINGLGLNLLSEAIGIAVTVFVIDRLLERREQHRWRDVRHFFWKAVQEECIRLNEAFRAWLTRMNELARSGGSEEPSSNSGDAIERVLIRHYPSLAKFGREPLGCDFAYFAGLATPEQMRQFADAFLAILGPVVRDDTVRNDEAWSELGQALSPPLARLEQLATMYSTLMEPQLAFAVLSLNRDLGYLRRGADLIVHVVHDNAALSEWGVNLDKSMQGALVALLKLNAEVAALQRKEGRAAWWDFS